jgi:hypothetical protein
MSYVIFFLLAIIPIFLNDYQVFLSQTRKARVFFKTEENLFIKKTSYAISSVAFWSH